MCNTYRLDKKGRKGAANPEEVAAVAELIEAEIARKGSSLTRRTGPGIVVTGVRGELTATTMRWGFRHEKYREVNNTRASSLRSPFWAESLAERRCIVPISLFYEWQELPEGAPKGMTKQCYSFQRPDEDWMWVAGLWQEFEGLGRCYSTITTEPPAIVEPIHDRMLAVLEWEAAMAFLDGDKMPWSPYAGDLAIQACPSPLRKKSPPHQPELF